MAGPDGLVAPAMEQIQQPLRIGGLLLERLALQAKHQAPATSQTARAQFDHGHNPCYSGQKRRGLGSNRFRSMGHPICWCCHSSEMVCHALAVKAP